MGEDTAAYRLTFLLAIMVGLVLGFVLPVAPFI